MKEGQTQEPVGGMGYKTNIEIVNARLDMDDYNALINFLDRMNFNYTVNDAPIKTEGEDEKNPLFKMWDNDEVPDLTSATNEQKDKLINGLLEISAKEFLKMFMALGLSSHIETKVINYANGEEFMFSFKKIVPPSPVGIDVDHEAEKEVMMQAFDKVYKMFQARSWIMDGRGSYPYNDDRYKEEVRYLFDEFESLHKDTWANIKSKSVDFRKKVIEQYKNDLKNPYIRLSEGASLPQSSTEEETDSFAISFAIWALHDPQAKAYQEAGITAYGLLEKYKNRPFVNTDTSKQ